MYGGKRSIQTFNIIDNVFVKFSDKCSPDGFDVCRNGGSCSLDKNGNVKCVCPNEYHGQHCEIGMLYKYRSGIYTQDQIKLSIIIEIFNLSTYLDKCLEDDGLYKCLNGGTCFVDDTGHANCKCFDQYDGSICEHGKSHTSY